MFPTDQEFNELKFTIFARKIDELTKDLEALEQRIANLEGDKNA